ncbi:L-amino acid N-acyltransferase YncA [Mucilaginibacter yixingensis]|uniref:L-amino acid N-acyltransferase YncA n=1 Tax=Mucilaginibacter yixingensis TaxID=1295612 RepID=A0A2T5JCG2_9SPHI|nr:GNAT family N-acetyltransferase [Mucilaginibacter yixingensis]PTQ99454.1 L-amino acid N-acyltransferase YncA [Mucilaginibacter yixingensis]
MYSIRKATVADTETIRTIANDTWWATYSAILEEEQISFMLKEIYASEKISAQLDNGTQTYLLLEEQGRAVAFAGYSPREEDADIYKLHKLYCLPETQGKGYGKILINAVIDQTKAAGKHTLDLNVNRYNKARSFYEKVGFAVVYEEDVPIGPYWMNDYVMRLEW